MSPAEELREVAKLMRERAAKAAPGPWAAYHGSHGEHCVRLGEPLGKVLISSFNPFVAAEDGADADHIAGMHPGVALALADWLDRFGNDLYCYGPMEFHHALAIARAYLAPECSRQEQAPKGETG